MYDAENVAFKFSRLRRHLNSEVTKHNAKDHDNKELRSFRKKLWKINVI